MAYHGERSRKTAKYPIDRCLTFEPPKVCVTVAEHRLARHQQIRENATKKSATTHEGPVNAVLCT